MKSINHYKKGHSFEWPFLLYRNAVKQSKALSSRQRPSYLNFSKNTYLTRINFHYFRYDTMLCTTNKKGHEKITST